jgi:hypothetical protein
LKTLATGFVKLRHLTLHCEVGIDWKNSWPGDESQGPLLPRLDGDLAKEFAEPFFTLRSWSRLDMLTLKTGETLRRFPQWPPKWLSEERGNTKTIHIRAPSGPEGGLVVDIEDSR